MINNRIKKLQWQQTWKRKKYKGCEVCCFKIPFLLTFLELLFLPMKLFRYTGHVKIPWISCYFSNMNSSYPGTHEGDSQRIHIFFPILHLFASLNICRWPKKLDSFSFYCRWLKQKQSKIYWKMMRSKKLRLIMKTQVNCMSSTFVESLSLMKKVYLTTFQILTTIAYYVTFSSMIFIH